MNKQEIKLNRFKVKIEKLTQKLKLEVYEICENLDYHNSSVFSYNVDRLEQLNKEVQEFNIIHH
jgi:hypothetical protein